MILFYKFDEIADWRDLRPLSILPAAIIKSEKLLLPILKSSFKGAISMKQYADREGSDCNLAKIRLFHLMTNGDRIMPS
jgi:hypothetical protein